jgi:hypothetical protein
MLTGTRSWSIGISFGTERTQFDGPLAGHPAVAYSGHRRSSTARQLDDGHDARIRDVRHLGPAGHSD